MPRARKYTEEQIAQAIRETGAATRSALRKKNATLYENVRSYGLLDLLLPLTTTPREPWTRESIKAVAETYATRHDMQKGPHQHVYKITVKRNWHDLLPPIKQRTHVYVLQLNETIFKVGATDSVYKRAVALRSNTLIAAGKVKNAYTVEQQMLRVGRRLTKTEQEAVWKSHIRSGTHGQTELREWSAQDLHNALSILNDAITSSALPAIF